MMFVCLCSFVLTSKGETEAPLKSCLDDDYYYTVNDFDSDRHPEDGSIHLVA